MIEKLLFNQSLGVIQKGLDTASLRNQVISNNLANVDTPGFKRSEVLFEDALQKAMTPQDDFEGIVTNEKHIPIGGTSSQTETVAPRVVTDNSTSMRNDGNNVDIDREMSALAKNTVMYNSLVEEMNGEFQRIKIAIEGR